MVHLFRALIWAAIACAAMAQSNVAAADAQLAANAHFVTQGTFALDPAVPAGGGPRRILTYVPISTLVMREKSLPDIIIGGQPYAQVVTQNGLTVLILKRVLSERTFFSVFKLTGDRLTIFHDDYFLCPADNAECTEDQGQMVPRGSVLNAVAAAGGPRRLQAQDGSGGLKWDGVISEARYLDELNRGVISEVGPSTPLPSTFMSRMLPLASISTDCGQSKKSVTERSVSADLKLSVETGDAVSFLTRLAGLFKLTIQGDIAAGFRRSGSVEIEYGDGKSALKFHELSLIQYSAQADGRITQTTRKLQVQARLKCVGDGPGALPVVITQALVSENGGFLATPKLLDFYPNLKIDPEIENGSKAFEVYSLVGRQPFLTSISSRVAYARLLRIWNERIRDPNLANVLLAVFNATCPAVGTGNLKPIVACDRALEGERGIYASLQ
ncbi:MAG: hypothetical protein WDN25_25500 [Acetobacteraceae bacterium]